MRGDGIRYAIEHCGPELGQAIWEELMAPHPDRSAERERKARECEARALKAEGYAKGAKETVMSLVDKGFISGEQGAEELKMRILEFVQAFAEWKVK